MSDDPVFGHASASTGAESDTSSQVDAIFEEFGSKQPPVVIAVPGKRELDAMEPTEQELTRRGIEYSSHIITRPERAVSFAENAAMRGIRIIISASAHNSPLTTMIALHTELPVIAVPLSGGSLSGLDALLSTVQTTPGSPVACMAIDGAHNAAVFAAHVLNAMPMQPPQATAE